MPQPTNYLTLKQAAQQLGVHEQTLRSWERQGVIHLARLPKSGYQRVPVEEVLRLQGAMRTEQPAGVRMAPPKREAGTVTQAHSLATTVCTELVDLATLQTFDEWIQTRRGRTWLP